MYGSLKNLLDSIENPLELVCYDFKNEAPTLEIRNESNSIQKFKNYKSYNKNGGNFDCDNSNGTCNLTNDLYKTLWGWDYKDRYKLSPILSAKFQDTWKRFGADTINSFQTTYNIASKILPKNKIDNHPLLNEFAKTTHSIGNFTLVPFHLKEGDTLSFNQYRGTKLGDYFDLSLKLLKDTVDFEVFKNFIDTFFLNDYVDDKYNIIPLFSGHKKLLRGKITEMQDFYPQNEVELNEYLENVTAKIKARGLRIIAALKGVDNFSLDISPKIKTKSKFIKKLIIALSICAISFLAIFLLLFLNKCNEVGGFLELSNQHGFFKVIFEGISMYGVDSIILSVIVTAVMFFLYYGIKKLFDKIAICYLGKCVSCGKLFAMKKQDTKLAKKEEISILVELKEKDGIGRVIGTKEDYIPGERWIYKTNYRCKYCSYKSIKTKTKDVKKV